MSLVNEALKKARLEAARQDAARRGLPLPGTQPAGRSRPGSRAFLGAAAVALLVLLALTLFLAGRRLGSEDAARTTSIESTAATAPASPPVGPAGSKPSHSAQIGASEPAAATEPPEADGPRATGYEPASAEPVATDVIEPRPPATHRPQPAIAAPRGAAPEPKSSSTAPTGAAGNPPAAAAPEPADRRPPDAEPRVRIVTPGARAEPADADATRTVVRVLELPGGIRIELGGIAWSEQRPFALLNGRVVGPGDKVESLAVVAIAQRHVELRGEAGHFVLKLK